jgi:protein O-mannosyl-transferase
MNARTLSVRYALLGVLIAVALVYGPGLTGPFVFDDGPNVLEPPGVRMQGLDWPSVRAALASNSAGPFGRPLAGLSFALNHLAGGFEPLGYKVTNLAIHLACVLLGALLVRRLLAVAPPVFPVSRTAAPWTVSAAAALLWGLHPINLTSVLYVVQRMTSLSALLVLAGLLLWLAGRMRLGGKRPGGVVLMLAGLAVGVGLGAFAKENALLMPLFAGVIELTLLGGNRATLRASTRAGLRLFWMILLAVPAVAAATVLVLQPEILTSGYAGRPFTLGERILTQARALWLYVSLIGMPDISRFGLYHDYFQLSRSLFDPPTTLVAVIGWILAVTAAWQVRRRAPWLTFGVLWFLAGHAMESTIVPLELVHEHRNYLPSLGLIAGVTISAAALPLRAPLRVALTAGVASMLAMVTAVRAYTWSEDTSIIQALYRHHPNSAAANRMMGEVALKRAANPVQAVAFYTRAAQLAPHETGYAMWPIVLRGALFLRPAITGSELDSIEHALRNRPLTPSTLYILRGLTDCVDRGIPDCKGMEGTVARWLVVARQRTQQDERRQMLTVDLARVLLATHRLDEGAAMMREALAEAPDDGLYLTLAANFSLLAGRYDEADGFLDSAQSAEPYPDSQAHIIELRTAVRERRQAVANPRGVRLDPGSAGGADGMGSAAAPAPANAQAAAAAADPRLANSAAAVGAVVPTPPPATPQSP